MPNGRDLNMQVTGETGPDIQMTVEAGGDAAAVRAEKWANGTANGVPVPASTNPNVPTSENNAKYWANQARGAAGDATKYPKVQGGTWWYWDAVTQQYVDSGYYASFHIVKNYASISAMNADFSGTDVKTGEMVMVVNTVEDPDNAKVYIKGNNAWQFLVDMSGATGIQGPIGVTPQFSIGTVTGLSHGSSPTASVNNTDPTHPVLNLGIPAGASGNETIDDTAGLGDTDLVYSADKITKELSQKANGENVYSYKSKSGSIVTVDDAVAEAVKQMRIEIAPVQDLHGYDNPWPAGGWKNLANGGNQWNVNASGVIESSNLYNCYIAKVEQDQTYTFSANGSNSSIPLCAFFSSYPTVGSTSYNSSRELSKSSPFIAPITGYIVVRMSADSTETVQIEKGSIATPYTPYSNICPITGWSAAKVVRTGKNLLNESTKIDGYIYNEQGSYIQSADYYTIANIPVKVGETYTYSFTSDETTTNRNCRIHGFNSNGTWIQQIANLQVSTSGKKTISFVIPNNINKISVHYKKTFTNVQLEFGSSATSYVPYGGNKEITIPFSTTYYGGTLTYNEDGSVNVVIDRAIYTISSDASISSVTDLGTNVRFWVYAPNAVGERAANTTDICSILPTVDANDYNIDAIGFNPNNPNYQNSIWMKMPKSLVGSTSESIATYFASNPCQITNKYATPQTFTITVPELITMLQGYNTVYADCGDVDLLYAVKDFLTQEEVDKERVYETVSTSASVMSFEDGADNLPMKVVFGVEPVQDLHGQSNPYPPGCGKNLCNLNQTIVDTNGGGTTFTTSDDGTVVITATNVSTAGLGYIPLPFDIPAGSNVTISLNNTDTNAMVGVRLCNAEGTVFGTKVNADAVNKTATVSESFVASQINLYTLTNHGTVSAITLKIQVELGTSATAWSPYSNICPISGWTGANVTRAGINLYDAEHDQYENNKAIYSNGQIQSNNYAVCSGFVHVPSSSNLNISAKINNSEGSINVLRYDESKNSIGSREVFSYSSGRTSGTFTTPSNCKYIRFSVSKESNENVLNLLKTVMLELGTTYTSLEAFEGGTNTIPFPSSAGTVYSGTLTVNKDGSGDLSVNKKSFDLGSYDWQYDSTNGRFISTTAVPSDSVYVGNARGVEFICSKYNCLHNNEPISSVKNGDIYFGPPYNGKPQYIYVHDNSTTDPSTFKTSVTGQIVVYPLATPVPYTLTAPQVKTALGYNVVYVDTGDILTVNYPADTKLYIDKKFAELSAAITVLGT